MTTRPLGNLSASHPAGAAKMMNGAVKTIIRYPWRDDPATAAAASIAACLKKLSLNTPRK